MHNKKLPELTAKLGEDSRFPLLLCKGSDIVGKWK